MADEQDILLREIDEELKQDNLERLWKKYRTLIIGSSLLLVAFVAAFKAWEAYTLNNRITIGERFMAAQSLIISANQDAARDSLDAIAQESVAGYQMLAKFQLATLATKRADWVSAIDQYKAIFADETIDLVYRELAIILGAFAELESKSGNFQLVERTIKLASGSGPWRFSAKEIGALSALLKGDNENALMRYTELNKEAAAPQGLRERAQLMLDLLAN